MDLALYCRVILIGFCLELVEIVHSESNSEEVPEVPEAPDAPDDYVKTMCKLDTAGLCEYYGYKSESHHVTTPDGYILGVFRCYKNDTTDKNVVILHHGLLGSSDDFTMNPPQHSLAYMLADADYDVWLINARGNYYSRQHISKNPDDPKSGFFNFSWDDIALIDYPAIYRYVQRKTRKGKFYAVGYSRGSTTLLALLSSSFEYNKRIIAASLLSPVVYMNNGSPMINMFAKFEKIYAPFIENKEFLPRNRSHATGALRLIQHFAAGHFQLGQGVNKTMAPIHECHSPSGASANEFIHYGQIINTKTFATRSTDRKPAITFHLDHINVPLSLHCSESDPLTGIKDFNRLVSELRGKKGISTHIIEKIHKFDHGDFVTSMYAADLVYKDVLDFLKKY